jgi:signal transduction histidine kinase
MRQRNSASCETSCLLKVCRLLLLLLAGWMFMPNIGVAGAVIALRAASYVISDSTVQPPDVPVWSEVTLPHRSARPAGQDLTGYWYRLTFDTRDTSQPLWLLFPKLRSGGTIYLNGLMIGKISEADLLTQRRWFRPYMFLAPPVALHTAGNEILVHFTIREPLTSFGEVLVGPEQAIRLQHDRLLFWENTVTEVASILCLILGAFTVVIWVCRRQEALYGMFSVCALFWGVRTIVFRMPEVTMDNWVAWRFMYYFTTAGFIVCISLFMLRFSQCVKPGIERFLLAYWLGGCALFLILGVSARHAMDSWWTLGFLPFTIYSVLVLLLFARRTRSASAVAMLAAVAFAFALALHDYAVQHGLFKVDEFYLLHLGIPAFLLVMALILLERFLNTLALADSMQESLTAKVAERERELLKSHERLRKLERLNATAEERQRIMQNLHDGVGSQLVTSLMLVKQGTTCQADMVSLLQECIDEMRMALDSLSTEDDDLLPVLGNFRARISSRFSAIGLPLKWVNVTLPETVQMAPQASLQVLRILQEALANVLKHARAATVTVTVAVKADALVINVMDDGVGVDASLAAAGHGVGNMRQRAERIGGALQIMSGAGGTVVRLSVPLIMPGNLAATSDRPLQASWSAE